MPKRLYYFLLALTLTGTIATIEASNLSIRSQINPERQSLAQTVLNQTGLQALLP
ncbi:MAG: hypothetical protein ACFB2W_15860 [Leptolyngbyaceae cyanobacterium]